MIFNSRTSNVQPGPTVLRDVRPKIPRSVCVALVPLVEAEKAISPLLQAAFHERRKNVEEEKGVIADEHAHAAAESDTGEGQLFSDDLQRKFCNLMALCAETFRKVMKIGHWLAAWEVLQKTDHFATTYSLRIAERRNEQIQSKLQQMYGHFEKKRQLGLHDGSCATTKTERGLLPIDQMEPTASSNILLHLYSLDGDERRELLFGDCCRSIEESGGPPKIVRKPARATQARYCGSCGTFPQAKLPGSLVSCKRNGSSCSIRPRSASSTGKDGCSTSRHITYDDGEEEKERCSPKEREETISHSPCDRNPPITPPPCGH